MKNLKTFPKKVVLVVTPNDMENTFHHCNMCPLARSAKRAFKKFMVREMINSIELYKSLQDYLSGIKAATYKHTEFRKGDYNRRKKDGRKFTMTLTRIG